MTFFIRNHLDESKEWKKSQADTENKPNVLNRTF